MVHAFLSSHQDTVQLAYFALILISLWVSELIVGSSLVNQKLKHSSTNLLFIFTALPIQLGMITLVLLITVWTNQHHWGLINHLPWHKNAWVYYVTAFILMDLCEYTYHVIMHKFDFLWKFHLVHHSDLEVDVSTTIREHPGETFVRTSFFNALGVSIRSGGYGIGIKANCTDFFKYICPYYFQVAASP
jgi:sterol desaturase/sphingolipid hydroxylase (fatty acid hydroxylase superfamily)